MRNVLPQTIFFKHIRLRKHIFKHIRLCKYFFKHIRLRSANIFYQHHLRANNFFHFLTATVESHFFKKYLAIFRFVICLKQSDHFLVPKVCQFLF